MKTIFACFSMLLWSIPAIASSDMEAGSFKFEGSKMLLSYRAVKDVPNTFAIAVTAPESSKESSFDGVYPSVLVVNCKTKRWQAYLAIERTKLDRSRQAQVFGDNYTLNFCRTYAELFSD